MIWHENEIRNQRTNWFLVIQGFLINGICEDFGHPLIPFLIAIIGIIICLSFNHAAWRSTLAVSFAISCWKNRLNEANLSEKGLPPISLITKEILEVNNSNGKRELWKAKIQNLMYSQESCKLCVDKIRNSLDLILPYRLLPIVFCVFWVINAYLNRGCLTCN